jgi:hypothetical protein
MWCRITDLGMFCVTSYPVDMFISFWMCAAKSIAFGGNGNASEHAEP